MNIGGNSQTAPTYEVPMNNVYIQAWTTVEFVNFYHVWQKLDLVIIILPILEIEHTWYKCM